jgi:hypothetical protein
MDLLKTNRNSRVIFKEYTLQKAYIIRILDEEICEIKFETLSGKFVRRLALDYELKKYYK